VALGTDTLGSVRIPASYCGVVGYLPGSGLIDSAGVMPLMPEFDRVGVLARSVADAARVASIMAGRPIEPRPGRQSVTWRASTGERCVAPRCCWSRWKPRAFTPRQPELSAQLRAALEFGRTASPERIARARERIDEAKRRLDELLERYDVLVLPTTPQTAFPFDGPVPPTQADFTVPASVAGLAAISVPAANATGCRSGPR
jgi:aspartyl-tRNA(Asn)/glutamyl-tRNA(Gln) amidotransferase subunit A